VSETVEVIGMEWMLAGGELCYGHLEAGRYAAVRTLITGEYLVLCRVERVIDREAGTVRYQYTPLKNYELRVADKKEGGVLP
jgi:hypothetical protein